MIKSSSNENIISSNYYPNNLEYYDYLYSDHLAYSKSLLVNLLPIFKYNKINTVLDACCGSGNDVIQLYKEGFEINASDLCDTMVSFTKNRFDVFLKSDTFFFTSNVLNLSKSSLKKFDLVLFRGNTLGHLNSQEQLSAIQELIKVSNSNGLILIDFRNGVKYFERKKKYEQRGYGIDNKLKNIFFSFYRIKFPSILSKPYLIKSYLFIFNYKHFQFINYQKTIQANFVIKENIIEFLKAQKLKYEIVTSDKKGLPFLESILIHNY